MSEVRVTINGKELLGRPGQTILELALENGIEIPNLCYDPRLRPSGSCRLCLVEVEGQADPVASCTYAIASGMQVRT
ncbi:MAG: 2Fe-2S iron-sulfur cluster-binding protein, partial [Planctomycetota bacterium]